MKFSERLAILDKKLKDINATHNHAFAARTAIICQNWLIGDIKQRTNKHIEDWDIDDIIHLTDALRWSDG